MTQIDEPNLDELLGILIEEYGQECNYDALVRIKALIATQIQEARIDEIKRMREGMTFAHMTPSIYAAERIQTILSEKDTGVGIQNIISEDK